MTTDYENSSNDDISFENDECGKSYIVAVDPVTPDAVLSADAVENALLDGGLPLENLAATMASLDTLIEARATSKAGEAIRRILSSLDPTNGAAVALRRAVCGPDGESSRTAADRCGIAHQVLLRKEAKIRQALKGGVPPSAHI